MAETTTIRNTSLSAEISALGAELTSLKSAAGDDFLWGGDPAWWRGRSPLLFPIVGKVPDDQIVVDGVRYPMKQHGLARTAVFSLVEASASECRYRLTSSDETRAAYPFDFTLEVRYALAVGTLTIAATVANTGDKAMPMSFGFHPAFRWPLPGGGAREEHVLTFDAAEPAPIRRLHNGQLAAQSLPTPVEGKVLHLRDDLFVEDAVIFDRPVSRGLTYSSPTGPSLRVAYPDMPHLGIWSKPGAGFVCIEPWQGHASPEGFDGELADKPGMVAIMPGATERFGMSIALEI